MKISISLSNADAEFKKLSQQYLIELEKSSDKTVAQMVTNLKEETPIDTGFARESWSVTKKDKVYLVENSAEYIEYLNRGSSKQAPANFIESVALKYGKPLGTIVDTTGN